jgi:hypothetical protein
LALRFLVAVDVEGFSRRSVADQAKAQDNLERVLARAASGAGLDRRHWYRQPGGDGELAILPEATDGLSLVASYPGRVAAALASLNRGQVAQRLRVRMAIHHGAVAPGGSFGPVGMAPVVVSRLLDAQSLRRQLRQNDDLDIALIVSATVFNEVIQTRMRDLRPEAFRRVIIRAKNVAYVGYLCENVDIRRPAADLRQLPVASTPTASAATA